MPKLLRDSMRLIIVSNRIPVSIVQRDGKPRLGKSNGGLVTGLNSYLHNPPKNAPFRDYRWFGWNGTDTKKITPEIVRQISQQKLVGVPLEKKEVEDFYNGFCNDTIWPLFHYFSSYVSYNTRQWEAYKKINEKYCETLIKKLKPDDTVWIHDYHLMLLPGMLRKKMPGLTIGFFLHIPFPVFEIFRLLPVKWRREILEGMLGADLVGFHTYDYSRYFIGCVQRLLGFEHHMGVISAVDHNVKVDVIPMGIDYKKFHQGAISAGTLKKKKELKKVTKELKIILSIDRLDYTKGIPKRLEAYELFLKKNPQWRGKAVLMLTIIPSRTGVDRYQKMKKIIDGMIGKINGTYSTLTWTPIIYQYRTLPFHELSAMYNMSDVALVTPLRDGMNLIAKEYLASQTEKNGTLILSEMAGAAQELGEAFIINPLDVEQVANTIKRSLTEKPKEQRERNTAMQERLKAYSVQRWADDFIYELQDFKLKQNKERERKFITAAARKSIMKKFYESSKRLIVLDYDGTLVPFSRHPQLAKPDDGLKKILTKIAKMPDTNVVLISGRDRTTLSKWFKAANIDLIAEHGIWKREKKDRWKMIKPFDNTWKKIVIPILRRYRDRLPGSIIEEKEFSVAWHYRAADPELALQRAQDLANVLLHLTVNLDLHIIQGNRVIEIRNAGADKGNAMLHYLKDHHCDFILCIGDDTTDEDMFKSLPASADTIKVGGGQSSAKFFVNNHQDVRELLKALSKGQ